MWQSAVFARFFRDPRFVPDQKFSHCSASVQQTGFVAGDEAPFSSAIKPGVVSKIQVHCSTTSILAYSITILLEKFNLKDAKGTMTRRASIFLDLLAMGCFAQGSVVMVRSSTTHALSHLCECYFVKNKSVNDAFLDFFSCLGPGVA